MQSFDRPTRPVADPSPWVERFSPLVAAAGPVLDLACGDGRHSRFFGARGHPVTAVDVDTSGLGDLANQPGLTILEMDLEAGAWPFTDRQFAGIVITNYLHRPHFNHLPRTLAPGGVLIMETFAAGNGQFGRPRNADFLLAPGELLAALGSQLQVVAYEQGIEREPRPAVRQRICAVRTEEPVAIPRAARPLSRRVG